MLIFTSQIIKKKIFLFAHSLCESDENHILKMKGMDVNLLLQQETNWFFHKQLDYVNSL